MDCTSLSDVRQEGANESNEAIAIRWPHLRLHGGRPFETVGRILERKINSTPNPLPDGFINRLIVTVASRPQTFGRLFAHAISEAERGAR